MAARKTRKTIKEQRLCSIFTLPTPNFRPPDIQMALAPRLRIPPKEPEVRKRTEDDASGSRLEVAGRPTLLSFDEMPQWFQDDNNEWVIRGYRPISDSVRVSFRSWRYLHNETVNIYTHLIPAFVFLFGEWYILQYLAARYSRVISVDFVAFSCFMLTATICYASSAVYHTLMNHSYAVDHLCHRIDMAGIGIFITGDIILGVYIIFWCETALRNLYWSMVSKFSHVPLFLASDWQSELTLSSPIYRSWSSGH